MINFTFELLFSRNSLLLEIKEIKYAVCHQIMADCDDVAICSILVLNFEKYEYLCNIGVLV